MNSSDRISIVVPTYISSEVNVKYFYEAMNSLLAQSEDNWDCYVVNDCSDEILFKRAISPFELDRRFHIINNEIQQGPGISRNIGIDQADQNGSSIIIFLDADDIAVKDRVKNVRTAFSLNPECDVVYGRFSVIDEFSEPVLEEKLSFSIREIIKANNYKRVSGSCCWMEMATLTGYCNLTSATAVRTKFAKEIPFPTGQVSEDYKTWMAYAVSGTFYFDDKLYCRYRIPQSVSGSATREREGVDSFYKKKMELDKAAFDNAYSIAFGDPEDRGLLYECLLVRHYMKSFETVYGEGYVDFSKEALFAVKDLVQGMLDDLNAE